MIKIEGRQSNQNHTVEKRRSLSPLPVRKPGVRFHGIIQYRDSEGKDTEGRLSEVGLTGVATRPPPEFSTIQKPSQRADVRDSQIEYITSPEVYGRMLEAAAIVKALILEQNVRASAQDQPGPPLTLHRE